MGHWHYYHFIIA